MGGETERYLVSRTFTQSEFDAFARLSGDDNPIHVDPGYSAQARFGRPVAHGMWLFSALAAHLGDLFPGEALNEIDLMFPGPTYADEPMEIEVTVTDRVTGSTSVSLEIRNPAGEPTCTGSATIGTLA